MSSTYEEFIKKSELKEIAAALKSESAIMRWAAGKGIPPANLRQEDIMQFVTEDLKKYEP